MAKNGSKLQTSDRPVRGHFLNTKGLTVIVTGGVIIVALLRARRSDLPLIVNDFARSYFVDISGWLMAFIILIVAIIFIWFMRKDHQGEIARLAKERDDLQGKLLSRLEKSEQTK